ncbi:MAG: hypothetical protein ACI38P_03350 [Cellulosimicrobium funkei]
MQPPDGAPDDAERAAHLHDAALTLADELDDRLEHARALRGLAAARADVGRA